MFLPPWLWETLTQSCSSLLHTTDSLWMLPPLCCHHMLYFPSKCKYSQSLCLLYCLVTSVCVSLCRSVPKDFNICMLVYVLRACLHEWRNVCVTSVFSALQLNRLPQNTISIHFSGEFHCFWHISKYLLVCVCVCVYTVRIGLSSEGSRGKSKIERRTFWIASNPIQCNTLLLPPQAGLTFYFSVLVTNA